MRSYLYSLASLARVFQDRSYMQRLDQAGIEGVSPAAEIGLRGRGTAPKQRHNRFNNLILKEAAKIAQGANCTRYWCLAIPLGRD